MSLTCKLLSGTINGVEALARDPASFATIEGDELARRLTELARAGQMDGEEWNAVQEELARRRVEQARSAPPPPTESLRSQIVTLLAKTPRSTPSQVAESLSRNSTVVSRVLSGLLEAGLVTYETNADDGRIRHYRLTAADLVSDDGDVRPPSPTEEERQYLGLVIDGAVRARRSKNDLVYAADRLGRVLEQATQANADDLALRARSELVTTLRQAERSEELERHLGALGEITAGNANVQPHLVAVANGCLDYELGRKESLPVLDRIEHLTTAATVFRRYGDVDEANDWSPREGWAILSRAELWRQQTEFGAAVKDAKRAEWIFSAYDDTYGSAEATRIQGFCQRLRGYFPEAITILERSLDLAAAGGADRCRADVLQQLGDALRCTGDLRRASETLREAADVARTLGRTRTLGFSLTALGAVKYAAGDLDEAWILTKEAEPLLASSGPGRALNARRRAVIARDLGEPAKLRESKKLFRQSMAQYDELGSPAGVAACCVGLGKVETGRDLPGAAVDHLVQVASSGDGRLLLPLDPWISGLVKQWAEESDLRDVRRVADWTFRRDRKFRFADEMAGEPRVKSVSPAG
jgi:tetratricopeptide (TPR) repeat protein